jgi:hypothetical protein
VWPGVELPALDREREHPFEECQLTVDSRVRGSVFEATLRVPLDVCGCDRRHPLAAKHLREVVRSGAGVALALQFAVHPQVSERLVELELARLRRHRLALCLVALAFLE